jgi:hypothetical protein
VVVEWRRQCVVFEPPMLDDHFVAVAHLFVIDGVLGDEVVDFISELFIVLMS